MEEAQALRDALLTRYGVRKSWAQKTAFIDWAMARGVRATVEESGRFVHSRNLIFGDVERASVLITAHYDTCARLFLPNWTTPGNWALFCLTQAALYAALVLAGVLCGMLAGRAAAWAAWLAGLAGSAAALALMLLGPANPSNANDNTSGVLLLMLAMRELAEKPGVAFVLFDNEEKGLLGSAAFIRWHPRAARRFLLNLDCVGDGRTLLYTGSKAGMRCPQARRLAAALSELAPGYGRLAASGPFPDWIYPSDQMLFPRGTALAALKGERVLYLDRIHTPGDTALDLDNLRLLLEAIVRSV